MSGWVVADREGKESLLSRVRDWRASATSEIAMVHWLKYGEDGVYIIDVHAVLARMGRHDDRWRGWHVNLASTEHTDKDFGEYVEDEKS